MDYYKRQTLPLTSLALMAAGMKMEGGVALPARIKWTSNGLASAHQMDCFSTFFTDGQRRRVADNIAGTNVVYA